ncbi:small VCP/p97-interacting protein-like [Stegodyphus dumicola]|uniref:small VCP/p97-interacting protein-like n=1 Tax=Stegodyphus dumicola TaxID=202533 RepID=UPI0015AD5256|nr:small VCP/p97-interacting protein-like [Stegodyphus dumicola]
MGVCTSCCGDSEPRYTTPSKDERRQKMIEAAERRLQEQERRGLKEDGVRRLEQSKERAKKIDEALEKSNSDGPLRWQVS